MNDFGFVLMGVGILFIAAGGYMGIKLCLEKIARWDDIIGDLHERIVKLEYAHRQHQEDTVEKLTTYKKPFDKQRP